MEERSQSVLEVMDLDGGLIGIEDTMDDYWEEEYHFKVKSNKDLLGTAMVSGKLLSSGPGRLLKQGKWTSIVQ